MLWRCCLGSTAEQHLGLSLPCLQLSSLLAAVSNQCRWADWILAALLHTWVMCARPILFHVLVPQCHMLLPHTPVLLIPLLTWHRTLCRGHRITWKRPRVPMNLYFQHAACPCRRQRGRKTLHFQRVACPYHRQQGPVAPHPQCVACASHHQEESAVPHFRRVACIHLNRHWPRTLERTPI